MRTNALRFGVAVLLASMTLVACDDDRSPQYTKADPASAVAALAARFAPKVYLAQGESFNPMDATEYVRKSQLWFNHGSRCTDADPVVANIDLPTLAQGDYHHSDADPVVQGQDPVSHCQAHNGASHSTKDSPAASPEPTGFYLQPPKESEKGSPVQPGQDIAVPVYWEHQEDQGRSAYVYWFFYPHNDLAHGNKHDGDWERVAVRLNGETPIGVTFSKHGGAPCMVPWQGSVLERSGEHPIVYAAKGSHGSYPTQGSTRIKIVAVDERSQGAAWPTWTNIRPADKEPWWNYSGWWGPQVGIEGFNGPTGPHIDRFLGDVFTDQLCDPSFESPPVALPAAFEGDWETRDPITQDPAVTPYHMRMTLAKDKSTVQYRTDWTASEPKLECSGSLTPVDASDTFLEAHETIETNTRSTCVKEGNLKFVRDGDSLKMSYASDSIKASGTLYRKTAESQSAASSTEAAIKRFEQFLHAVGKEDLDITCEIAGPAAKKAEDEGIGTCRQTFPITFSMISTTQKKALESATVDRSLISASPKKVEIPAKAVKATSKFTSNDLGDFTLEYLNGNWFITD